MTHEIIVALAALWSVVPDHLSLVLMHGDLVLNGDGSFVTSESLSARLYGV